MSEKQCPCCNEQREIGTRAWVYRRFGATESVWAAQSECHNCHAMGPRRTADSETAAIGKAEEWFSTVETENTEN